MKIQHAKTSISSKENSSTCPISQLLRNYSTVTILFKGILSANTHEIEKVPNHKIFQQLYLKYIQVGNVVLSFLMKGTKF